MENKPIARKLRLLSQLMELHDINPFKVKSIANAAFKVDKLPFTVAGKSFEELEKIDGIGKSLAAKIVELLNTGTMAEMEELLTATPPGVVEMMGIKGIGAKKVSVIWHEMGIETVGELYYACNENRLIEAKGFGLKTQEEIRKAIEFAMASSGKFLYAQIEQDAKQLIGKFRDIFSNVLVELAGDFRRLCEIITELTVVLGTRDKAIAFTTVLQSEILKKVTIKEHHLEGELENGLKVCVYCVEKRYFFKTYFEKTGNDEHVKAVLARAVEEPDQPESEEMIYQKAGLEFIRPELREGTTFIEKAAANKLPQLINYNDLKGTLHNHSTWSDGVNTIEEMALFCRDKLKLEYLGMCDHSKSAFYAKGLSIERVLQQQEEIDHLNKKISDFHVFKGIESDILNDGSLDYPEEILKKFDFIVASVHSNLKMNEEKATERLIKAIENPYTTILGHPTGRLLLSRNGYTFDHKKVIDACAANNVVIEINANPLRLDLDWRWHQYALNKGVWLSINPDAHRNEGFLDMHYGVLVARKGGLYKERCLNALSLQEITQVFKEKKNKQMVIEELKDHQHIIQKVINTLTPDIEKACEMITAAIKNGNRVLIAGNGGSAADAQHIAAELSGRFVKDRRALPGIAITTDTSAITSIANDYGYEHVFSRQLEALAQPGDLFIGISTSGNSEGILNALRAAKKCSCATLGLSGRDGGGMNALCDLNIIVPSTITARIQEMHILIGHILCKSVDDLF